MEYESTLTIASKCSPGVSFTINRMSFGRRTELIRRIREMAAKVEFLEAGNDSQEKLEATLLATEIDRVYLLWGLVKVEGLVLDGQPANPESLVVAGPEPLCREILAAIKGQLGLSEDEQKN